MLPNRSSRRRSTAGRRWQRRISRALGAIGPASARLGKTWVAAIGRIRKRDQLLALLLLLLWIVLLLGNFYFRGVSRFEGSLITKTISFTYVGEVDKQFLNSLDLPKLMLKGQQSTPLTLQGKFFSADPTLNAKLKSLSQLEIQLATPLSGLTLEAADAKQPNPIGLRQLRILPQTQVEQLTYQAPARQIQFCLQSSTATHSGAAGCDQSSTVAANVEANAEVNLGPVGKLEFGVNPAALKLFLANVQIPALDITASTLETELRWLPAGQDFVLPIVASTALQISLPKVGKNTPAEAIDDLTQFIRGDIAVQQVRFSQLDRSGNVNDDILTSEILDGEVRMMGQSLKLQPRQFLIIPTERPFDKPNCRMSPTQKPGIQRLRDIRLNVKEPPGLQTLISGESKCLAIGLYQEFPTQSIEPSWLLKYLPQEGINAIYTLIGAFTGILFPRLFPDPDEPKK